MSALGIIDGVIGREGRYSNDPNDAGGATMWGITERVARAKGYAGDMSALPREFAVGIYMHDYVNVPGFDKVAAVSPLIGEEMIDTGVNMGPALPAAWLQRTLNALNQQSKLYPDLVVDGQIGAASIAALRALLAKRGADGEKVIMRSLNCLQGAHYLELAEKRVANETFFFGWMLNRVECK